ncbi:hypothetical protein SO802_029905 [Lithocarpus litseifolius]|uniref:CCHC-type domain-containing protein n=1 Tax=Lithocarpus litseifolius TaxID=425828 RepID=A0AAW2BWB4_9ROSI
MDDEVIDRLQRVRLTPDEGELITIWGLSFDLINEEAGLEIGKSLGKVVEVDCKAFASDQARFLRVRVEIPLDKSVHRGGPVVNPEGDQTLVAFKYERLCGLCFQCGRIGHKSKECNLPSMEGEELPYGEWMKAGFKKGGAESRRTPDRNMGRQETAPESGGTKASP